MDCLTFVIGLFVFVGIITALLIKVFNYNIFFILPIVCVIWIFVNPDMVLAANIVSLEAPGESISMASNNDLNIISLSNLIFLIFPPTLTLIFSSPSPEK